jgi:hypothetical protein
MDEQERGECIVAYYLARSISCYLGAIVLAESGKGPDQRLDLSDSEKYAANMMLTTVVSQVSKDFRQDPFEVHLLALAEFWGDVYSYEDMKSLQVELIDECSDLLAADNSFFCGIGSQFWNLSQRNDADFFEELGGVYRLWVESFGAVNHEFDLGFEPPELVLH